MFLSPQIPAAPTHEQETPPAAPGSEKAPRSRPGRRAGTRVEFEKAVKYSRWFFVLFLFCKIQGKERLPCKSLEKKLLLWGLVCFHFPCRLVPWGWSLCMTWMGRAGKSRPTLTGTALRGRSGMPFPGTRPSQCDRRDNMCQVLPPFPDKHAACKCTSPLHDLGVGVGSSQSHRDALCRSSATGICKTSTVPASPELQVGTRGHRGTGHLERTVQRRGAVGGPGLSSWEGSLWPVFSGVTRASEPTLGHEHLWTHRGKASCDRDHTHSALILPSVYEDRESQRHCNWPQVPCSLCRWVGMYACLF